jgi:hypothetical protein
MSKRSTSDFSACCLGAVTLAASGLACAPDKPDDRPERLSSALTATTGPHTFPARPVARIERASARFSDLASRQVARPPEFPPPSHLAPFGPPPNPLFDVIPARSPSGQATPAAITPEVASPTAAVTFLAAPNQTSFPPDTMGAVGPDHLVVTVNRQVIIQHRDGSNISSVALSTFWSSLTGISNVFDPRAQFDNLSGRFVVTSENKNGADSTILIAVSQTNDPTQTWNFFQIDTDAANDRSADFPNVGFNKDWIVVTVRMFPVASVSFVEHVIICDKASLIAGTSSCNVVTVDPFPHDITPAISFDPASDTEFLARVGSGTATSTQGAIVISTITGPVGSETFTLDAATTLITGTWNNFPPTDFAPQKGQARGLETDGFAQGSAITNLVARNEALWGAHTINLPEAAPTHTAVQWFELDLDGTLLQTGRIEDTTANVFFAYPSVGVNVNSDLLIGYSRFSSSQFVSANYSFRAGGDAAGTLRDDFVFKAGEDSYLRVFNNRNRWGDYSNTMVDPRNDRHLWTVQEFAATGGANWGTQWGRVGNDPPTALCRDFTTSADSVCLGHAAAADVDNGSSDPDGDHLTCSLTPPGPFALGPSAVVLTCSDPAAATSSCGAQVKVVDTTPPTITAPPDITVASCLATNFGTPTTADNCSVQTPTNNAPSPLHPGATTITWTVKDGSGNSASANQVVTVKDVTPPVFTFVPPAITISKCVGANIGTATAKDDCGVTVTSNAPVKFPLGTTIVTWTATDGAGNKKTATQAVTAILGDDPSCCPSGTHIIQGTSGSDNLTGTAGSDCILGKGGDDVIDARGGNDFVSGGAGNDTIAGGDGNDRIYGGGGNDTIDSGPGDDFIDGGSGIDTCAGGTGTNTILACEVKSGG